MDRADHNVARDEARGGRYVLSQSERIDDFQDSILERVYTRTPLLPRYYFALRSRIAAIGLVYHSQSLNSQSLAIWIPDLDRHTPIRYTQPAPAAPASSYRTPEARPNHHQID